MINLRNTEDWMLLLTITSQFDISISVYFHPPERNRANKCVSLLIMIDIEVSLLMDVMQCYDAMTTDLFK